MVNPGRIIIIVEVEKSLWDSMNNLHSIFSKLEKVRMRFLIDQDMASNPEMHP
jgi:hypothetical protein